MGVSPHTRLTERPREAKLTGAISVNKEAPELAGEVRAYEMLYILRPDLDEEGRRNKIARVQQVIESQGGQVQGTDEWGPRILAYEIDHFREGYYVLVTFTLPADKVQELESRFSMDDEILRYQVVRLDGK
jgi:small subunit ribosomal protein S6